MAYDIGEAPENRTVNGFFCTGCNSLLLSLYTHDYKICECGNMVDGGSSYVRRGYMDFDSFKKVVEIFDWACILVAAEIGFKNSLNPLTQGSASNSIYKLIKQERLIFTADAEEPEGGEKELGLTVMGEYEDDYFSEEELAKAQIEKEAKNRARATELAAEVLKLSTRDNTD